MILIFTTGESHDAYQQVYEGGEKNESSFSHELVAGGAAFAGFKAFEDHQRKEGKLSFDLLLLGISLTPRQASP